MDGALRLMDVPPDDVQAWVAKQAPATPAPAPGAVVAVPAVAAAPPGALR